MYVEMKGKVRCSQFEYDEFNVSNGIKQRAVLSLILFNIYIDSLIKSIHNAKLGCYIGNKPSSIYLSPIGSAMKEILLICQRFSIDLCLKLNSQKSESMVILSHMFSIKMDCFS